MRCALLMLAACGGSGGGGSSEPRTMFVTADGFTGDFRTQGLGTDGIDGADALCAFKASNAGLPGTYLAWMSSAPTNAIDRMADGGPWLRTDGARAFADRAALAGVPEVLVNFDEHAQMLAPAPDNFVWTGTHTGGTASQRDCDHWTNGTGGINGEFGQADNLAQWTESSATATGCLPRFRLYCFEQ